MGQYPFTVAVTDGINMEFVLIPAGSFLMGSEKGLIDERPVHRVVISKPFYINQVVSEVEDILTSGGRASS